MFSKKIYFYDLGIRNSVIRDFRNIESREDVGGLWENFVITERMKQLSYERSFGKIWFWRTLQQKEIDIVEENNGTLTAIEIKWNAAKKDAKVPAQFSDAYPDALFKVITPDNVEEYLL